MKVYLLVGILKFLSELQMERKRVIFIIGDFIAWVYLEVLIFTILLKAVPLFAKHSSYGLIILLYINL